MWLTATIPLLAIVVLVHQCTGQCEEVWPSETLGSSVEEDFPISCFSVLPSLTLDSLTNSDAIEMQFSLMDVVTGTADVPTLFSIVSSSPLTLDLVQLSSSSTSSGESVSSNLMATDSVMSSDTSLTALSSLAPSSISSLTFSFSTSALELPESSLLDEFSSVPTPARMTTSTAIISSSFAQTAPSSALSTMVLPSTTVEIMAVSSSSSTMVQPSTMVEIMEVSTPSSTMVQPSTTVKTIEVSTSSSTTVQPSTMVKTIEVSTSSSTSQIIELSTTSAQTQSINSSTLDIQIISSLSSVFFTSLAVSSSSSSFLFPSQPSPTAIHTTSVVQPTFSSISMEQPSITVLISRTEPTIPSIPSSSLVTTPPPTMMLAIITSVSSSAPTITPSTTQTPTPLETPPTNSLSPPLTPHIHPSNTATVATTITAGRETQESILNFLTIPGIAGAAVGVALIIILSCILCCCCCVGCHRSRSKKRLEFRDSGYDYENKNATELYSLPNGGVSGINYRSYSHGSGLDVHAHHHYESAADVNAYLDRGAEHMYNGDHTQFHGSQPMMHHHSQSLQHSQPYHQHQHHHSQASALTDVFQKSTLPELSPMSYSLTANPLQSENFYLNALPTSNVSLREPTMFALSLQQEESKSAQGSRLSIAGSKTSIHNSIHGSRASNLHGSRPLVFNSGTSRESLLGLRGGGKEHTVDEEADMAQAAFLLSHRVPSPFLPPNSSTDNIELPTRDSPRPRQLPSTALSLAHGNKDFASLTCISDDRGGRNITSPSPSPLESPVHYEVEGSTHRKLTKRKDLSSLTSLDFLSSPSTGKDNRGGTIIEEEESSQSSKVNVEKAKDESPAIKKGRSKHRSRLEKLTSLDYIRQSFRLKKKKVSFEQSPEATPKAVAKKNSSLRGQHQGDTIIANEQAHGHLDNEPAGPERERGKMEWRQGRRNSSTSTDVFSPTENIARSMFMQHHHHAFHDPHAAMAMYPAQLSQPTYYLPPHMGGAAAPGIPIHPHMYPQLSQQFYPSQLSQPYSYQPSFHVPTGDPFGRGLVPPGGGRVDPRNHEVITPDYSDITTPEHNSSRKHRKISSEDEYELKDTYKRKYGGSSKYQDPTDTSPTNHSPDIDTEVTSYREGASGMHPEYSNGYVNNTYLRDDLDPMASPQRHGSGYASGYASNPRRGRHIDPLHSGTGEEAWLGRHAPPMIGHIPEDMYQNSISVDDPPNPEFYTPSHHKQDSLHGHPRMQRRRSDISETSERKISSGSHPSGSGNGGGGAKNRVSWNSTITTYDPEEEEEDKPELSRL